MEKKEEFTALNGRTMSRYTAGLIECLYLAKKLEEVLHSTVMEHCGTQTEAAEENAQEIWKGIQENVIGDVASHISFMIGESISEHLDDLSGTEF